MDEIKIFKSQYWASLEMFKEAVDKCPQALWNDLQYKNKFWHIAYHTLFCTDMYLSPAEKDFKPWYKHQDESNFMGPLPWEGNREPKKCNPYSKEDILEYYPICYKKVEIELDKINLNDDSGFHWVPLNKFELQIYNIRHIQHHTAQLVERLRQTANIPTKWVGFVR